jgi:hypothetical protein
MTTPIGSTPLQINSVHQAKTYPDGWKAPKPYIRIIPQPGA